MTLESVNSEPMLYPLLLEFFYDESKSWQPEMHLHNPSEHLLKFKVFTTAPKKYTVTIPEGSVQAGESVELVVKHSASGFGDKNAIDKLRFKFFVDGSVVGKRDIPLHSIVDRREHVMSQMMAKTSPNFSNYSIESSEDKYSNTSFAFGNSLPDMMAAQQHDMTRSRLKDLKTMNKNVRQKFYADQVALYNGDNVNYLVIIIGLICLTILFLPNYLPDSAQNVSQVFPAYLHVSYEIKIFCSFILGMVTMVILKN